MVLAYFVHFLWAGVIAVRQSLIRQTTGAKVVFYIKYVCVCALLIVARNMLLLSFFSAVSTTKTG